MLSQRQEDIFNMKTTLTINKNKQFHSYLMTLLTVSCLNFSTFSQATVEQSLKGIIDTRLFLQKENNKEVIENLSYLSGGYGKFDNKENTSFKLAQLGLLYQASWENNISVNIVANAFSNKNEDNMGFTEAFIGYKSLPSSSGWRLKAKAGLFYPTISVENKAVAWSNPYTLNNSTINTWVGEELHHSGLQLKLEKLGKFSHSKHDFSIEYTLFQNNDTAGAMLAWHGWTQGSRQSVYQEKLKVQPMPARWPGNTLAEQAAYSDPFLELDHRWGVHLVGQWRYQSKAKVMLGYYDNNANTSIVKNGQYAWGTHFSHAGISIKLGKKTELFSQYMQGNTHMLGKNGLVVVDNDFTNGFVMIKQRWLQHQIALKVEEFSMEDLDKTWGDNNQEYGKGITLSYRYRLTKHAFIQTEYNWLQSNRPSRLYTQQPLELIERQLQLALRYYF